jgi:ribonuclease Z
MKIVFLGTGGTYPSKTRNVTSVVVQLPGEVVMFDCGEGTQRQLMRSSVSFMKIKKMFVSHLHADHFLGIPGLVQSMSLNGREDALEIFGPAGTKNNVESMLRLGYFKSGFEVVTEDVVPGTVHDFGGYTVRFAAADHSIPSLAFCLEERPRPGKFDLRRAKKLSIPEGPLFRRLQEGKPIVVGGKKILPEQVLGPSRPGRKLVYTGDTKPSKEIIRLAKDADVLIHDCTLDSSHGKLASDFGHSTAAEAARVAKAARARTLFLVHLSPRFESHEVLEKEARKVFRNSIVAQDLMEFVVRYRN